MLLEWSPKDRYLMLPLENGVETSALCIKREGKPDIRRRLALARDRADALYCVDRQWLGAQSVSIAFEHDFSDCARPYFTDRREKRDMPFPQLPTGARFCARLAKTGGVYKLNVYCGLLGDGGERADMLVFKSRDMLYWHRDRVRLDVAMPDDVGGAPFCAGNAVSVPCCINGGELHAAAFIARSCGPLLWQPLLSFPFALTPGGGCVPLGSKMRAFERVWPGVTSQKTAGVQMRFRVAPGVWPDIRLLPPNGDCDDLYADAYELETLLDMKPSGTVTVRFFGHSFSVSGGKARCGYARAPLKTMDGKLLLHCRAGKDWLEIYADNAVICSGLRAPRAKRRMGVAAVSENISHCDLDTSYDRSLYMHGNGKSFSTGPLTVRGLRLPRWSREAMRLMDGVQGRGSVFYKSERFTVYSHSVEDDSYGDPPALITNDGGVLSPMRVCEEFAWRPTGFGDMVRAVNRRDVWLPPPSIKRYPALTTPLKTLRAAYEIALDTFALCTDMRYSLPGQQGMWASGLFQGTGEGFGVWVRDSAHVAMRCGNLIDPDTSRKTLLYTSHNGFDNASDGPAMAVVGLWDYEMATGDRGALMEAWPYLKRCAQQIESRCDPDSGLVYAPMSTSNDAFDEPENMGYPLSSETYYMLAFRALASIGRAVGHDETACARWESCAERLKDSIRALTWNEKFGFFTSGPKGSEAYERDYWETSGEESVVWNRFGIATTQEKKRVLEALNNAAMCEYGIVLFPNRKKENHFTGSVWPVWQAGFAQAAAETGNAELIKKLLAQQIRSAVINKTFYEVTDALTGIAWRWPGQLWHAASFVSLVFFGVLGMSYDESGMRFTPAVPEGLTPLCVNGLRYRDATLDIKLLGRGSRYVMLLDGERASRLSPDIRGRHSITLMPEGE